MVKNEINNPALIKEILERGPRVKRPKSRTDWDFLVYELKKMEISPGEAYRIIAEKKSNTNNRFGWENFISEAKKKDIIIRDPWSFFLNNVSKKNSAWLLTDDHPNCEAHI